MNESLNYHLKMITSDLLSESNKNEFWMLSLIQSCTDSSNHHKANELGTKKTNYIINSNLNEDTVRVF
jgi:hypothetical protein